MTTDLDTLGGAATEWEPGPEAWNQTLRKLERRRAKRRLATVVLAISVFAIPAVWLVGSIKKTGSEPSSGETPVSLLTYDGQVTDLARNRGQLATRDGCVFLLNAGDETLLAWPSGTALQMIEGRAVVLDASGSVIATEGQPLAVGGGSVSDVDSFQRYHELVAGVPDSCRTDEVWIVGRVL